MLVYQRITGWWFGTCSTFPHIGNGIIIPTDEVTPSFFSGGGWNHQPVGFYLRYDKYIYIYPINYRYITYKP